MKVLVIAADESVPLEVRDIQKGLKPMQAIVGGLIQFVDLEDPPGSIVLNEEGLVIGLPFNRRATGLLWRRSPIHRGHTLLVGDVFVVGEPDDEGETQECPQAYLNMAG